MIELLWIIPAVPIAIFAVLATAGGKLSKTAAAWTGIGGVGISAAMSCIISAEFFKAAWAGEYYRRVLWDWLGAAGTRGTEFALRLDSLSIVMIVVVSVVGLLICVYSWEFMGRYEGLSRYFAYMNLFVGAMLLLVLADNMVLLYLGWEGVGLCSFLLIGFWYKEEANWRAAMKAFIVTRIGDVGLLIGIILLLVNFKTANIEDLSAALLQMPAGCALCMLGAGLVLAGAIGKSAQLPLQVWLPDAMAGPTPVSALIHAATMVTAGVYLIARMHVLFVKAPGIMLLTEAIGAATVIAGALAAIAQSDIKRILAYSTISQIGYMFFSLGAGAWSAAVFHLFTHAFFKSTLFLCAGIMILAADEEHSIFRMGGLRKSMPFVFWSFAAAAVSVAAVPVVGAGFYSKDLILREAWASEPYGRIYWSVGAVGAFLTAVYAFKIIFAAFGGNERTRPAVKAGWRMLVPVGILALLSLVSGLVQLPNTIGRLKLFTDFLDKAVLGAAMHDIDLNAEFVLDAIAGVLSISGIMVAYVFWGKEGLAYRKEVLPRLQQFAYSGFGFDWLYEKLFTMPYRVFAEANKRDYVNYLYAFIQQVAAAGHYAFSSLQNGNVRWYAAVIVLGVVVYLAMVIIQ